MSLLFLFFYYILCYAVMKNTNALQEELILNGIREPASNVRLIYIILNDFIDFFFIPIGNNSLIIMVT